MVSTISTSAPFVASLQANDRYNLSIDGTVVYRSGLFDRVTQVDVQPVFVNYAPEGIGQINALYDDMLDITTDGLAAEMRFTTGTWDAERHLRYCTAPLSNPEIDWESKHPQGSASGVDFVANSPLQDYIINGQYISMMMVRGDNVSSENIQVIVYYEDDTTEDVTNDVSMEPQIPGTTFRLEGRLNLSDNLDGYKPSRVWIQTSGGRMLYGPVNVVNCVPTGSYILYYVNYFGAIDYLICQRKNSVTVNADRHNVERYATVRDRTDFGKQTYLNNLTRSWELNTDVFTDEQSKRMPELFNSPYIWLYDFENDRYDSVIITDSALKIKTFDTENRIFNYTIKVESSQTFTIR